MEIVILSTIQIIITIYNIFLFIISIKNMKDYDDLKARNEWQAKKIKELLERKK